MRVDRIFKIITLIVFLTACQRSEPDIVSQSSIAVPKKPYRVQLTSEPVSLDPVLAEDGSALRILVNVMDGLMGYDNRGRLHHRLAESHRVSDDLKVYEFTLRPHLKWSDGVSLTAEQMKMGLQRGIQSASNAKSKIAVFFSEIQSIETSGQKISIQLKNPVTQFLDLLTLPNMVPYREGLGAQWPVQGPSIGSFYIAEKTADKIWKLKRNPYSVFPSEQIDELNFVLISDVDTGVKAFENGDLDLLLRFPPNYRTRLEARNAFRSFPMAATYYLGFNLKARNAISEATRCLIHSLIPRKDIVKELGLDETVAYHWLPPGLEGFNPLEGKLKPSVVSAGKRLSGTGGWDLQVDQGERNRSVVDLIQKKLSDRGFEIVPRYLPWKEHIHALEQRKAQIFRFGWLAPYLDSLSHLEIFVTDNPNNYTGWSDPVYDSWVREIRSKPASAERTAMIQKAENRLVYEKCVIAPVFHYSQSYGVSRRTVELTANPLSTIRFAEVQLRY